MKVIRTPNNERQELCFRIRTARQRAKLSQTALAERVGVTPSAAAQWESMNGTNANLRRLRVIAEATGVSFEWLITGKGRPRPQSSASLEEAPALVLGSFARDIVEEMLLERFRRMPRRTRDAFCQFLAELTSKSR